MAESMIKRAVAAYFSTFGETVGDAKHSEVEDITTAVRAVIASLRDDLPDDVAMAGVMHDYSLEAAWRAMIDAILAEGEKT